MVLNRATILTVAAATTTTTTKTTTPATVTRFVVLQVVSRMRLATLIT